MYIDFILSIEATFVNITFHTTLEDNLQKTTELRKKQIPQPCILTLSYLSRRLS